MVRSVVIFDKVVRISRVIQVLGVLLVGLLGLLTYFMAVTPIDYFVL